ncbi:lactonase family protein [Streptomyces sp. NBC_00080]|uniref:beta-propeller fold lactonase family protein n=1 Tax=Streptomyces sp. NBC_00080 TaxID=2975645 RepID=UPI00324EE327
MRRHQRRLSPGPPVGPRPSATRRGPRLLADAVFPHTAEQRTGKLRTVQSLSLECKWPRDCAISPDGRWLVVSCLYSDELITLEIGHDGRLRDTGIRTPQTTAANVTFYQG